MHDDAVRIRGCDRGDRCSARVVDDPVPRPLIGWTCGSCRFGNVAELFGQWAREAYPWPPEMLFEGKADDR